VLESIGETVLSSPLPALSYEWVPDAEHPWQVRDRFLELHSRWMTLTAGVHHLLQELNCLRCRAVLLEGVRLNLSLQQAKTAQSSDQFEFETAPDA
jgi:hypothetical protein